MIIKINDQVVLTTTSQEDKCLADRLCDIENWIVSAINGQVNHAKLEMFANWQPILIEDVEVESMPANENDLIDFIAARSYYKTAAQRMAEEPTE